MPPFFYLFTIAMYEDTAELGHNQAIRVATSVFFMSLGERRGVGCKLIAGCNMDFNTLCKRKRWLRPVAELATDDRGGK